MDNIEQDFGLNRAQYEKVANFYYLIYSPNLARGTVKLLIDGTIEMIVKREQFFNIIKEICTLTVANYLDSTCSSHGGFYLYDREKNKLTRLSSVEQVEKINAAMLHQSREKLHDEKSSVFEKIIHQNPLNSLTQSLISPLFSQHNRNLMERRKVFTTF